MEKNNECLAISHDCLSETLTIIIPMATLSAVSLSKIYFDYIASDDASGLHRFSVKLPVPDAAKIYGLLHLLFEKNRLPGQMLAYEKGQWLISESLKNFFNKLDRRGQHTLNYAAIAMSQAMKPAEIPSRFELRLGGNFFARLGDAELRIADTFGALAEGKEHKQDWHPLVMTDATTPELKLGLIIGLASACASFNEEEDNRQRALACR